jgi:7-cyano-7-deazaguanine synthase in queuosine biosynthesis
MIKEELVLFSGGIDSTVLLKFLLKETNKLIRVLYNKLGYDNLAKDRLNEQNISSKNILKYLFKKYRPFEYTTIDINFSFTRGKDTDWLDDQWNAFLAGKVCRKYNIDSTWIGYFHYNYNTRKKYKGSETYWYHDGSLDKLFNMGHGLNKNLKLNIPYYVFNGTSIDSLKTKKEAYDYLELELQSMVRSCEGKEKFCGQCYKCSVYIQEKIKND